MLIRTCLLLICVGVLASYADEGAESKTDKEFFDDLDFIFPKDFVSKFPKEGEFFRLKIFAFLFFNMFSKYLGENEPMKFWSNLNQNDYYRVAIDALFYEYLTKFTDRKMKHLVFDPLERSTSSPEDIAIDRIGSYLDSLSEDSSVDPSETDSHTKTEDKRNHDAVCGQETLRIPTFGIPGEHFPNHCDIPRKTSFTCKDKLVPGIYADVDTGCQVFHVCWPHRIDSFLCPIGTIFNQALLTCDFWHESECSVSHIFGNSQFVKGGAPKNADSTDETLTTTENPYVSISELDIPEHDGTCQSLIIEPLKIHLKFLPEKCWVRSLNPSTVKSSKYNYKHFNQQTTDIMSSSFEDGIKFLIRVLKIGRSEIPSVLGNIERSKFKMEKHTSKSNARIVKPASEYISKKGDVGLSEELLLSAQFLSDEPPQRANSRYADISEFDAEPHHSTKFSHEPPQRANSRYADISVFDAEPHHSTKCPHEPPQRTNSRYADISVFEAEPQTLLHSTELPSDEPPQRENSRFADIPLVRSGSLGTDNRVRFVRKSTLLKPNKSPETKKHAFDIIMRTIELAVNILNDSILPFIEKIVEEYHQKSKSKKF